MAAGASRCALERRHAVQWVKRWGDTIAAEHEPNLPGVWRRKDGGFRIRGRTRDPKTHERREVNRALPKVRSARVAADTLRAELAAVRERAQAVQAFPRFEDWAATVLERKVKSRTILSADTRATWASVLENHLFPAFGGIFINLLTREDIERWKNEVLLAPREHAKHSARVRKLAAGRYSPNTANTVLGILRQITKAASREFNIRDAAADIENVSKRGHRTYTYEAPNALKPEDVPRFLDEVRVRYADHYAFVFLGFTTGLRPSSLRPLRRSGPNADIKWDTGELLVRRSHTRKSEVMEATKTDRDQVIALDPRQLEVLRWHVERLDEENRQRAKRYPHLAKAMAASELLFPAPPTKWNHGGGFRSKSCLDKMFTHIGELLELGYEVTPRCMRRTYQDLCRAANVADIVTRSISGHATPEMQRHYSTVSAAEQRAGLGAVIDLALERAKRAA
jgi:hypothetical protein